MTKTEIIKLFVAVIIFAVVIAVVAVLGRIDTAQTIQLIITFVLVLVTVAYVKRTAEIASATREQAQATKEQADASVKMAEEMREQRVMASRPVIIQRAVYKEGTFTDLGIQRIGIEKTSAYFFSHFEVYNAGNGPAIEVEISLLNKEKILIANEEMKPISWRESFLRASDPAIKFRPPNIANLEESITYYLVCEYQSILSQGTRKTWYQTWLPFETVEASKEGKIYVKPGELEFYEVSEKERIDAFGSRSKPK